MSEQQTCPRRMDEIGPWKREENADYWRTNYWDERYSKWRSDWQPRVCSFCGGVSPEDAIRMIGEGWRVEGTDKDYKRYLQPPGGKRDWEYYGLYRPPWFAVPPVKLYIQHFTQEQVDRFNAALVARRLHGG